jgi:hypothetical protein
MAFEEEEHDVFCKNKVRRYWINFSEPGTKISVELI